MINLKHELKKQGCCVKKQLPLKIVDLKHGCNKTVVQNIFQVLRNIKLKDRKHSLHKNKAVLHILIPTYFLWYIFRFLFKNKSWSTWAGLITLLSAVTMSPAVENIRSAATLVPGTQRVFLARLDRSGNTPSCFLHQFSGSAESSNGSVALYAFTSIIAWVD